MEMTKITKQKKRMFSLSNEPHHVVADFFSFLSCLWSYFLWNSFCCQDSVCVWTTFTPLQMRINTFSALHAATQRGFFLWLTNSCSRITFKVNNSFKGEKHLNQEKKKENQNLCFEHQSMKSVHLAWHICATLFAIYDYVLRGYVLVKFNQNFWAKMFSRFSKLW